MEFRADLHCHSICSDGSDLPEELLFKAKKSGLQGLSITDHDTVAAYTEKLFLLADSLKIALLVGVEISSEWKGRPVHILGYRVDPYHLDFLHFLKEVQEMRKDRNLLILEKLSRHGMHLKLEELKGETIGRPHIAEALVKKGYLRTVQEAFEKYLKDGAICSAPGFRFSPLEVIAMIQKMGGKAILAHPHLYPKDFDCSELLSFPFDGIECHYGTLSKNQEAPWVAIAKEKGWIATGGSDYHGSFRSFRPLGSSWVGQEVFSSLQRD